MASESQGVLKDRLKISEAVRKFRIECGLTQVQFAVTLGIAATTVYRYEAGASAPDFPELKKLLEYAVERGNASAQRFLLAEVASRMGLDAQQIEGLSAPLEPDPLSLLEVEGRPLSSEEKTRIVALVLLLRHSTDATSRTVIDAVLEPWVKRAQSLAKVKN